MTTRRGDDLNRTGIGWQDKSGNLSFVKGFACVNGHITNRSGRLPADLPPVSPRPLEDTVKYPEQPCRIGHMPYIVRRSLGYRMRRWLHDRCRVITYIICLIFCCACWYGVFIMLAPWFK